MKLREEIVDFVNVRQGSPEGRVALAKRIFALWQPIFSHLDGRDYRFHLEKHVEDESAVQIRGIFGVDAAGRDQALMIFRVHEHALNGEIVARATINAGFSPALVQSQFGQNFIALEAWRYIWRHPLRPFFIVDCAVSAASYCVYAKYYVGFAPTRERPIPEAWWPLAEIGARALGGAPVEGARREVRCFPSVVRVAGASHPTSESAKMDAAFFSALTQDDPSRGLLVMAPLDIFSSIKTNIRYLTKRISRRCRRLR